MQRYRVTDRQRIERPSDPKEGGDVSEVLVGSTVGDGLS